MDQYNQAPMVISQGGYAALMRVLLEQDDLLMTDIQSEPILVGAPSANRFYRQRLTAEGENGVFQLTVILKVLPAPTWSEAWNPRLDGPAEIVALESDLLTSLPQGIFDPTLASARARDGRPAWTISTDLIADLGQGSYSAAELRLILVRLAEAHALHWDAGVVLDYVYPWLTRQHEWIREAASLYAAVFDGRVPDSAAGRLLLDEQPLVAETTLAWVNSTAEDALPLRRLVNDPTWLIETLAATPPTVCHGAAVMAHMGFIEDRLVLIEWEKMQVAPSSWDVWTFWSSLDQPALTEEETLDFYLDTLERIVGPINRDAWLDSYALAPVVGFLLNDLPGLARHTSNKTAHAALTQRAGYVARLLRAAGR